jgi:signal transduction histidine kinase
MNAEEFARRFRVSYPDGSRVPPEHFITEQVFDEVGPLRYKAVLYPPGAPKIVIAATAAPVRESAGGPVRMVVSVMHDITVAEHLERSLDQLLATAAHTLKTPVAVIKANAQILAAADGTQVDRAAAAIERQCGKVDQLVQNLLVLARVRSSTLQLYPQPVDLGPLLDRVCRGTLVTGCRDVRWDGNAPYRVHADPERLSLALRDLIAEAARRSEPGAAIRVAVARKNRDVIVTIAYRPAPPEHIEHVSSEYDDLGIGRLVAETVIGAHGGMLWEERSEPEHAFCFVLNAIDAEL